MALVDLIMPKMGESIMEATILRWSKNVGDKIEMDETVLEIATDKVDSEVPSPVAGVLQEIRFPVNSTVPIGSVIAVIATAGESGVSQGPAVAAPVESAPKTATSQPETASPMPQKALEPAPQAIPTSSGDRFYSPLVRKIAHEEKISSQELDAIPGSGLHGRVTKKDILGYVENRTQAPAGTAPAMVSSNGKPASTIQEPRTAPAPVFSGDVEIVEMDRMRKLIADHMVMSKQTSAHVTSFVEADVTAIVQWRNRIKEQFQKTYGENITFTPIFIEAITRAIRDFPMVNSSVDGTRIFIKKDINLGMAAALPSGNLIVPVIKQADTLNLIGLTKVVNDLARRARNNQLKPEEIQGGTFTLTNVGTFGNVMGTPIISQPQVAIMATGAIRKKPAVIETPSGDMIAIRHMMFLSLSYDHRIVDGYLGGSFLRRVADYLEAFDPDRKV